MEAARHEAEAQRVAALRRYAILDTPREKDFDDIVAVVSAICETPISVINFIDEGRQWFKAEVGLGVRETPLPASICAHAILQHDLLVVPDTLADPRFSDNPLVIGDPRLRFYAGALLETADGLPLGTICVLDTRPRKLTDNQMALLRLMASQIMKLLESRQLAVTEHAARMIAEQLARDNEVLARESDHRVMNSLQLVSSILALQGRAASPSAKPALEEAQRRVRAIATVHRQLHLSGSMAEIEIAPFLHRLCESLADTAPPHVSSIVVKSDPARAPSATASALGLILAELIANSFKHAFPDGRAGSIGVTFAREQAATGWKLVVRDDGIGLAEGFDPAASEGIGMRVITSLVSRLNARFVFSSSQKGAEFRIEAKEF